MGPSCPDKTRALVSDGGERRVSTFIVRRPKRPTRGQTPVRLLRVWFLVNTFTYGRTFKRTDRRTGSGFTGQDVPRPSSRVFSRCVSSHTCKTGPLSKVLPKSPSDRPTHPLLYVSWDLSQNRGRNGYYYCYWVLIIGECNRHINTHQRVEQRVLSGYSFPTSLKSLSFTFESFLLTERVPEDDFPRKDHSLAPNF